MQDEPQAADKPFAMGPVPSSGKPAEEMPIQRLDLRPCLAYGFAGIVLGVSWIGIVNSFSTDHRFHPLLLLFAFCNFVVGFFSLFGLTAGFCLLVIRLLNSCLSKSWSPSALPGIAGGITGFFLCFCLSFPKVKYYGSDGIGLASCLIFALIGQIACHFAGAVFMRFSDQPRGSSVRFSLRDWFVLTAGAALLWSIGSFAKMGAENYLQVLGYFLVTQITLCGTEFLLSDPSIGSGPIAPPGSRESSVEETTP